MNISIYTSSDQKTLYPVINLLNKEINLITKINTIQSDKRVKV